MKYLTDTDPTRSKKLLRTAFTALCVFVARLNGQSTGAIAGSVVAPDGTPVSNAAVLFSEQPAGSRRGTVLVHGNVRTQANGTFTVRNLVPGSYQLCVQASWAGLLDPCLWSKSKPMSFVIAGRTTSGVQLKLIKGSRLRLRLDDPNGHVQTKQNKRPDTHLVFTVRTINGFLQTFREVATDAEGRDYEALVPTNTPLRLTMLTRHFDIADQTDVPVAGPGASPGRGGGPPNPPGVYT